MKPQASRRIAVLAIVAAAIVVPAVQNGLHLGLTQAQFAGDGDTTLRAAPYAFAIWGLIYLGLTVYAVFQLRARESAVLSRFGWPSAIAAVSCAAWIVASALDWKVASVAIILVGWAAAVAPLLGGPAPERREKWLVVRPNALLAGWLTAAAALNILTVLTAFGVIGPASAQTWALSGLAVVVLIALAVAIRSRSAVYLLPVAWALIGVHVAEMHGRPVITWASLAGALVALAASGLIAWNGRRAP